MTGQIHAHGTGYEHNLDSIEAAFLQGKKQERLVIKGVGELTDLIDISSAASMNLFKSVVGLDSYAKVPTKTITSYPYLVQKDFSLEEAFSNFFKKWAGVVVPITEIVVFNGVYGSYRSIVSALPGSIILVPEAIHQTHKACFAALGKQVIEIPLLSTKLLDLEALEEQLERYGKEVVALYLYHARPAQFTKQYYAQIAKILGRYDTVAIIDNDVWYTTHQPDIDPLLALRIPALRKRSIYLFNLTKEIGAPGIRIGFGICNNSLAAHVKHFQQIILEMIPPVTRQLAVEILSSANLKTAKRILRDRMKVLVDGLNSLGFSFPLHPQGVNVFLHVPKSFTTDDSVSPDHLFSYFVLTRAHVLLRPATSHGKSLSHYVRFVLCQDTNIIKEIISRFKKVEISNDMALPVGLIDEYKHFAKTI